jgi:hypothetical protein
MKTYNGWANFATWLVNLQIFDGMQFDEKVDTEMLKMMTRELVFECGSATDLCENFALAFLNDVNWHEIADHINENF